MKKIRLHHVDTRQSRRRSAGFALVVSFSFVVTACSSGGGSSSSSASAGGDACGTLVVGQITELAPQNKALFADYQKTHPCVKLQTRNVAVSTIITQLLTQKLGNSLPDVIQTGGVWSNTLTTQGVQADLTPYLNKKDLFPKSYWLQNFLAQYIPSVGPNKGKVFGLPMTADATVIYYNKDLFKKAGVPFPTADWTWSDMRADAKKLAVVQDGKQVQWGLANAPDWEAAWNPIIEAYGGCSFCETKSGFNSPEALKAYKLLIEPTMTGDFLPWAQYSAAGFQAVNAFTSQQAAMFTGVKAQAPAVIAAAKGKFDFDVQSMPFLDSPHKRPTGNGSLGWTMTTQAKDKNLALNFLKYLYSADGGQPDIQNAGGVVPAVGSLLGPDQPWRKQTVPANQEAFVEAAQNSVGTPNAPGDAYNVMNNNMKTAIESVVINGDSYDDAFGKLADTVNDAYAKAPK